MSLLEAVMGRREDVNHLKFLYDAFLPNYYWTEVMECLRKLLLTGFVVFFYEGSGLQVLVGLVISVIFLTLYSFLQPYLMPSNNTFASFVHFQISFTLACVFGLRVLNEMNKSSVERMKISEDSLSYALLIGNASVLAVGCFYILKHILSSSKDFDFLASKGKEIIKA